VSRAFKFNLVLIVTGVLVAVVIGPLVPSLLPPSSCSSTCPDPNDLAHGISLFGVAALFLGVVLEVVRRRENHTNPDNQTRPSVA